MGQQKKVFEKMQQKFSDTLQRFNPTFSKSEIKFLNDMTTGILRSNSCIVRQTAQSLGESISSKKTQERLIYHLDKEALSERISEIHPASQCHRLRRKSLVIVYPSDIIKPSASEMEGLS